VNFYGGRLRGKAGVGGVECRMYDIVQSSLPCIIMQRSDDDNRERREKREMKTLAMISRQMKL